MTTTILCMFWNTNEFRKNKVLGSNESYWDANLCKVNMPMVVYGDDDYIEFVRMNRPEEYKTEYHPMSYRDLEYYKLYYDQVVMNREKSWPTIDDRAPSIVHIITCSKIGLLTDVANRNPFNTDYFAYLDNNIMKKVGLTVDIVEDRLRRVSNTFHMMILGAVRDTYTYEILYQEYRYHMVGMVVAGDREHITRVNDIFNEEFKRTVDAGYGHSEEMIYIKITYSNPDLFTISYGDYQQAVKNMHDIIENHGYIYNVILRMYVAQGMYKQGIHCANKLLDSANLPRDLVFPILYEKYMSEYRLGLGDEVRSTITRMMMMKHTDTVYINNKKFYDDMMKYGIDQYGIESTVDIQIIPYVTVDSIKNISGPTIVICDTSDVVINCPSHITLIDKGQLCKLLLRSSH